MKKNISLVFIGGIFVFLLIFVFGPKVYGNTSIEENAEAVDQNMDEAVTDNDTAMESSESAEEKVEAVDQKMNEVLASDAYKEMSLSERKELASDTLQQLEQDGYITELSYDEKSAVYSFVYSDGTLGGWCIKDFSGQDGLLPTN